MGQPGDNREREETPFDSIADLLGKPPDMTGAKQIDEAGDVFIFNSSPVAETSAGELYIIDNEPAGGKDGELTVIESGPPPAYGRESKGKWGWVAELSDVALERKMTNYANRVEELRKQAVGSSLLDAIPVDAGKAEYVLGTLLNEARSRLGRPIEEM
jgi:hypothetical protein